MITIEDHDDEKRIVTTIEPFAFIDWPRAFLVEAYKEIQKLFYRSMQQNLLQIRSKGKIYQPIVSKRSYDIDAETYERLKRYSEHSGEKMATFELQPDGTYRRVFIGPKWGE